jgi:hypothetical protein
MLIDPAPALTRMLICMGRVKNLAGESFGRLTVESFAGLSRWNKALWNCRCVCGKAVIVLSGSLHNGTRSCGCLKRGLAHAHPREYDTWQHMMQRCYNPKATGWHRYGGRGIVVCERWLTFENFLADVGPRPEGTTLGRLVDEANYAPGEAWWQTVAEQQAMLLGRRILSSMGATRAELDHLISQNKHLVS